MICKKTLSDLIGDKILDLRKHSQHHRKEALELSMHLFHLEEINEQTIKPIYKILLRHPSCHYSKRAIDYLHSFNLPESHLRN